MKINKNKLFIIVLYSILNIKATFPSQSPSSSQAKKTIVINKKTPTIIKKTPTPPKKQSIKPVITIKKPIIPNKTTPSPAKTTPLTFEQIKAEQQRLRAANSGIPQNQYVNIQDPCPCTSAICTCPQVPKLLTI